jgi:hypothetical protein
MNALRPIFALFLRALRDETRSKLPPILRAFAVGFVLLLVAMNERAFERSAPGQSLLMMLAMVNLAAATVLGLGTFSSAITEEKEDETMGLLLMTRLNPLAILLGKSTARLAGGLLFVVVQIPFTLLCVTLGGVTVDDVLQVYAILGAYLVFLCNVCLLWSVLCRRTPRAITLAFVTAVLIYVLPLFLSISYGRTFWQGGIGSLGEQITMLLIGVNPVFDTMKAVIKFSGFPFPTHSIPFHLVGAGVCFLLSWLLFGRFCAAAGETGGKRSLVKAGRTSAGAGGAMPRQRYSRPWRWAVAWKDFHFLTGGLRGMAIRAAIYVALVGGLAWWLDHLERGNFNGFSKVLIWCGGMIFTVELAALAARIFGAERQALTLGSLTTLPSGARSMIVQKVLGCLPAFLPSVTIWVVGFWLDPPSRYGRGSDGTEYFLIAMEFIFFPVLVAYLSLRLRRGALLAAISIGLFGNILAAILQLSALTVVILFFATFIMLAAIPYRVEQCAAEE